MLRKKSEKVIYVKQIKVKAKSGDRNNKISTKILFHRHKMISKSAGKIYDIK